MPGAAAPLCWCVPGQGEAGLLSSAFPILQKENMQVQASQPVQHQKEGDIAFLLCSTTQSIGGTAFPLLPKLLKKSTRTSKGSRLASL